MTRLTILHYELVLECPSTLQSTIGIRVRSNLPGEIGDYKCIIDDLLRVSTLDSEELMLWSEPWDPFYRVFKAQSAST